MLYWSMSNNYIQSNIYCSTAPIILYALPFVHNHKTYIENHNLTQKQSYCLLYCLQRSCGIFEIEHLTKSTETTLSWANFCNVKLCEFDLWRKFTYFIKPILPCLACWQTKSK